MNTTARISAAERLGRNIGRGWRAYMRGEQRVSNWLASKGMPAAGATAMLWAVKVAVIGMLLYFAFWLALLLAFLVAVAHSDWGAEQDPPEPEWRYGPAGFGLYTYDDYRLDPHDSYDESQR